MSRDRLLRDEKLRKEVYKHLEFLNSPKSDLGTEIDHIMQLITADRKRVALEARISELTLLYNTYTWNDSVGDYLEERIAQLKKELEDE